MRVAAVIPVFDHGATLRRVVEGVLGFVPAGLSEVVVVDDGSTDGGPAGLAGLPVTVLRHGRNRGKGSAILTGARHALAGGATHVLTLDADGQHDPADIPRFLDALREEPAALVIGRRDLSGPDVPGSSRFGRRFSNFWMRVQTGVAVGDMQSGFRAYPAAVFSSLSLREAGFPFEVEVVVKAAWAGIPIREVPVSADYSPPGGRVSHFRLGRDNLRLALLNTRLTLRSALPVPHRRDLPEPRGGEGRWGFLHPLRFLKGLLRENATPEGLGRSVALGAFLGALPLLFVQGFAVVAIAGALRLNRAAALAACQLFMAPLGPALAIETGYLARHGRFLTEVSWQTLGREAGSRLLEWLLGGLLLGTVSAAVLGGAVYLCARALGRGGKA